MTPTAVLTDAQRTSWAEQGSFRIGALRNPVCARFAQAAAVVDFPSELIAPDIDVFLSQFIFKAAGAWAQPWHPDSFYFPFEPARPVVGVWLAVTEADNESDDDRAAMVDHYSAAGTVHRYFPSLNDWVPPRRDGRPTAPAAA